MGRESRTVGPVIQVVVSRHNSPQDRMDDLLADEMDRMLRDYARRLITDPRYDPISPMEL